MNNSIRSTINYDLVTGVISRPCDCLSTLIKCSQIIHSSSISLQRKPRNNFSHQSTLENLSFQFMKQAHSFLKTMAAIQPFLTLQLFKGTESENIEKCFRHLASCLQVANIHADIRHQYLHLQLKGGALMFFDQLPEKTRNDFEQGDQALRNRYKNDQETASKLTRESNFKNLSSSHVNSNLQTNQTKTS